MTAQQLFAELGWRISQTKVVRWLDNTFGRHCHLCKFCYYDSDNEGCCSREPMCQSFKKLEYFKRRA